MRKHGRKAKWLYRKAGKFGERVMIVEKGEGQTTDSS